ncbi:MAG: hypothetical protein QOG80_1156, partial [Pseudonocardiales bacterium]|nr:hypothetical protein [Pseudonocardiales bacterium]
RQRGVSALAADPVRDRLLVLASAPSPRIFALAPDGRPLRAVALQVGNADLAVTGSNIWLTGSGPRGAVVGLLDPATLRPGRNLAIAGQLGRGALLAAVGDQSLWLRRPDANRDVLWCTDATSGPIASWWTMPGTVASGNGVAFVANGAVVSTLALFRGCSG